MLKLTQQEQAWLDDYRKAIEEKHPGVVHEMLIYGSKARGQSHAESDLDVLLIVKNDGGRLKRNLRRIGYLLAATTSYPLAARCWLADCPTGLSLETIKTVAMAGDTSL